jgi:hypothetical protein
VRAEDAARFVERLSGMFADGLWNGTRRTEWTTFLRQFEPTEVAAALLRARGVFEGTPSMKAFGELVRPPAIRSTEAPPDPNPPAPPPPWVRDFINSRKAPGAPDD